MTVVRRVLLFDQPQETRFFAILGVFGIGIAIIYWIVSAELAGTILLLGFGGATALAAVRLGLARPGRVAHGTAKTTAAESLGAETGDSTGSGEGAGGGTGGVDRPFSDESGRLPDDTIAPLSLALGTALSITAVVFGPWLIIAGAIPLVWGAYAWLTAARDELRATEATDAEVAAVTSSRRRRRR
ncbi:MAG: hypothetical protein ACJ77N_06445 [Chloroflexota bacterium]